MMMNQDFMALPLFPLMLQVLGNFDAEDRKYDSASQYTSEALCSRPPDLFLPGR